MTRPSSNALTTISKLVSHAPNRPAFPTHTSPSTSGRAVQAAALFTAALAGYDAIKSAYQSWDLNHNYNVTVPASSPIYGDVREWLYTQSGNPRDVIANAYFPERTNRPTRAELGIKISWHMATSRQTTINIKGHQIKVVDSDSQPSAGSGGSDVSGWSPFDTRSLAQRTPPDVKFICRTITARDAVMDHITTLTLARNKDLGTEIYTTSTWGEWHYVGSRPGRPIETVSLPGHSTSDILQDLTQFFDDEDRYVRLGVPWHRGYLFHGVPGTGKTSLALALAHELGLRAYILSLASVKSDSDLVGLCQTITSQSILVIEDIDVAKAAKTRSAVPSDDETKGVTLSGLLNVLDGAISAHGLATILTTNHPEALDPAVVRPGRCDYKLNFQPITTAHHIRDLAKALGLELPASPYFDYFESLPNKPVITPADLVGVIKEHRDHAEARKAINEFIRGKVASADTTQRTQVNHVYI